MAEDRLGRIYVANYDGVLVFSGSEWELVPTTNRTTVRSLSVDGNGVVYVGAQGEFGYLRPTPKGQLQFISLANQLPQEEREFGDVWATHATEDGVYFQTSNRVYYWDGSGFQIYSSDPGIHTSFLVNGILVARERGRGLVRIEGGSATMLAGGEFYAQKRVFALIRLTDGYLVGTRDHGFYKWEGATSFPFTTEADGVLRHSWLYGAIELPSGELALATLGAGVIIISKSGRITAQITTANGAPDDNITSLHALSSGLVMATTHNSGFFSFRPPSMLMDVRAFEHTSIRDILIASDVGLILTGDGALVLDLDSVRASLRGYGRPTGTHPAGMQLSAWSATEGAESIVVATAGGLFRLAAIQGESGQTYSALPLVQDTQVFSVAAGDRQEVFAGFGRGLARITERGWEAQTDGADTDLVVSIAVDRAYVWATTRIDGVRRYERADPFGRPPVKFTTKEGLPANQGMMVELVGDAPLFYVKDSEGLYRFDSSTNTFLLDDQLRSGGLQEKSIYDVHESQDGVLWVATDEGIARAEPSLGGGYEVDWPVILRFARDRETLLATESNGPLWFTNEGRIMRYDPAFDAPFDTTYYAIIQRIETTANDSLLFGGFTVTSGVGSPIQSTVALELPYAQRGIRVEYGSPFLVGSGALEYRTLLEGHDKAWQPWGGATLRTISDVSEGEYTLRIEARNMFGIVSREATVHLRILPPWYRTWWAYAIYVLGGFLVVTYTVKYRRMVKAQKVAQEQALELARERRYSQRLQDANEQLKRANRLKDEFLATTSHELRTPITAILGFTEILHSEIPEDAPYREFVGIIEESGQRLMGTLTSLLDVARLRAGMMELAPEQIDFADTVREFADSWRDEVEAKGLYFKIALPVESIDAYQDPSAIERIIQQLIGNAIKFTEHGGITVEVDQEGDQATFRVHDTGIGIEARFLPDLFEEFAQESDGESRSHNGNGLGLAIVGGLARLMGGSVEVHSMKGVGSVFKVSLPLKAPVLELTGKDTSNSDASDEAAGTDGAERAARDRAPSKPGRSTRGRESSNPISE